MKKINLTPEQELERLQAQHRQMAAEARERVKQQKARTRRLIQVGAILENVAPSVREMDLEDLRRELTDRLRGL